MVKSDIGTNLPKDISSRITGLLSLVSEIADRVSADPVLTELLRDYQEMAREYVLLFEESLRKASSLSPRDKWLKRHEMLDKLTREWHLIYSMASAVELGSTHRDDFQPFVDQAVEDIGLTDFRNNFLLIPLFGESFSLVKLSYSSSNIAILNLPISVIHSPWELSVIWHEMAGLKVIEIREQIRRFLEEYARENDVVPPPTRTSAEFDLIGELFERIISGDILDEPFKTKVKDFLTAGDQTDNNKTKIWSQDWFEQLYEDACSVFAFGEEFVSVLEKILSRQAFKLTADRKHPDLGTRLQVARRLLQLQKGDAPSPATDAERLTDELLWAFIQETRSDPSTALPIAYSDPGQDSELRKQLVRDMQEFNQNFGSLEDGTINESRFDFGPMIEFAGKASSRQTDYLSDDERNLTIKEKLGELFENTDIDGLLKTPFSPSDELDYATHTRDQSGEMIVSHPYHGSHTVYHYSTNIFGNNRSH